jgi:SAM-dependent methyltransferase
MSYIYDFHNKYLGDSSYGKLINFYTCNIPISTSVVKRKNFFKKKILEILHSRTFPKVLSVGSGPARELLELIREARLVKPLYFDCLDFEKRALDYIQTELQKIESKKKSYLHIGFINKNILDLIKDEKIENAFKKYDLVYASTDPVINKRKYQLIKEARAILNAIKTLGKRSADPLTDPSVLEQAVSAGILDAPHLYGNPVARGAIVTGLAQGCCVSLDPRTGNPISEQQRLKNATMRDKGA